MSPETPTLAALPFHVTDEQAELRSTTRRFMEREWTGEDLRRLIAADDGFDRDIWARLTGELGLQALLIPERHGGVELGQQELAIVQEELGRAVYAGPFFATIALAVNALLAIGDETVNGELLPAVAAGELRLALALADAAARMGPQAATVGARRVDAAWRLDGAVGYVVDGHLADALLVAARSDAGIGLFLVDAGAAGLERRALPVLDQSRPLARVTLSGTPARLVGEDGAAAPALERTAQLAAVALAAEQLGGAHRCLDMTVAYVRDRVQFGRPLGSFQAIQFKCADMLLLVESSRSAVGYAAWAADHAADELPAVAALAQAYCSDAFVACASETIQLHGGIGCTWEHDAHLYFKRAKASELLLGDARHHRELLAGRVGI